MRKLDTKVVSNPDAGEAAASADHLGPGTLEGRREQTSGPPSTGGKCLGALGSAGGASVGSDSSSSHRARGHGLLTMRGGSGPAGTRTRQNKRAESVRVAWHAGFTGSEHNEPRQE